MRDAFSGKYMVVRPSIEERILRVIVYGRRSPRRPRHSYGARSFCARIELEVSALADLHMNSTAATCAVLASFFALERASAGTRPWSTPPAIERPVPLVLERLPRWA